MSHSVWSCNPSLFVEQLLGGGHVALFDKQTGDTHFLNELSVLVLSRVTVEGITSEQLLQRLQQWSGDELDADSRHKILTTLGSLAKAELIVRKSVIAE